MLAYNGKGSKGGETGELGPLNLPEQVVASEFMTMEGKKFSSSRGIVIYVKDILARYPVDAVRYYISIAGPETSDADFKWAEVVRHNNEELAAMGGKAAVEAAKDKGWDKITAIGIMGVQGDSTSEARIAGFKQGIAEAGGEYLSAETQYADSVADKAVTCMEAIIQAHPEGVSIIVANNDDMAAGAARAAAAFPAYKNTIFVGIGGNLAGIDAILAGQETMTVAVDGYDVGYLGVQAAVDALNGKKLDEFIATDATVVTADNAAERRAEVEKRLGQ